MNKDPASLSGLHDIVLPPAPGWWPLAMGWYVLGLLLLMGLLWWAYRYWRRYQNNRYRRAALLELRAIEQSADPEAIRALPALLKRTAIQAYSRARVAALSQENWLAFLDRQGGTVKFQGPVGQQLLALAYQSGPSGIPLDADRLDLLAHCRTWIKQHRAVIC